LVLFIFLQATTVLSRKASATNGTMSDVVVVIQVLKRGQSFRSIDIDAARLYGEPMTDRAQGGARLMSGREKLTGVF